LGEKGMVFHGRLLNNLLNRMANAICQSMTGFAISYRLSLPDKPNTATASISF
jgi:hypothetical protein